MKKTKEGISRIVSLQKYYRIADQIIQDHTKDELNIHKTSVKEYLRNEEEHYSSQKLIQISGYVQQELLLKEQHDKGLLSDKEYYKKIQELQKYQNSQSIDADIEYYS